MRIDSWLKPRLRLWAIYQELGYIPWRKPREPKKRHHEGVYIGTREAIPFMNDDAKRTLSHLLLRPGRMMRDYILRGQHERYLAPFTALLVFYSVFTLIVAVVQPGSSKASFWDSLVEINDSDVVVDMEAADYNVKFQHVVHTFITTMKDAIVLTRLDLHPEMADTPWKASLAAIEGDLRSKGIPLFLGGFLVLWIAMAILLKKYHISVSGAAAASAYVLCQFCIFMFLALLLSIGNNSDLGVLLMGVLLMIDYHQMLGIGYKPALRLTIKTGLIYVLILVIFFLLLGGALVLLTISRI